MDLNFLFMYLGFALAAYSVVGNDVIQTLGTFLSSNEKQPWYILWAFAATILSFVLIYGWINYGGDVSYGKLIGSVDKGFGIANPAYPLPEPMSWWYLIPPFVLLFITRLGIPVSTTFLILSFFATSSLSNTSSGDIGALIVGFFQTPQFSSMLIKSLSGYVVAFGTAIGVYFLISNAFEKKFHQTEIENPDVRLRWIAAQWISTGFLWSQWLIQDFANIYAYLPRQLSMAELIVSLMGILALLAYIFYQRGGAIQGIVKAKSNTEDIRSATFIDLIYGLVLFFFKELSDVPMSTTWVFIGLLAGREYAIQYRIYNKITTALHKMVASDVGKATIGLVVSIVLVVLIQWIKSF